MAWLPVVPDLAARPQLAVLSTLHAALAAATYALAAAHPEIEDPAFAGAVVPHASYVASTIMRLAEQILVVLDRYRLALDAECVRERPVPDCGDGPKERRSPIQLPLPFPVRR
jgi:hypothetical protein